MDRNLKPEEVLLMESQTDDFLVNLADNEYGIRFIGFKIRDVDKGETFHEFKADNIYDLDYFADHELDYTFPQKMLTAKTIGTNLTFVVGDKEVRNLDFIERHYIGNKLMANYAFKFPFFIPNTENNIEFMYPMPKLSDETKNQIKDKEDVYAKSDTFIFVNNKLIIHRRANYRYLDL
jgi:hypothetical protein